MVVIGMPTCPLNTPHVAPEVLHGTYPQVIWWAADPVATPLPMSWCREFWLNQHRVS